MVRLGTALAVVGVVAVLEAVGVSVVTMAIDFVADLVASIGGSIFDGVANWFNNLI